MINDFSKLDGVARPTGDGGGGSYFSSLPRIRENHLSAEPSQVPKDQRAKAALSAEGARGVNGAAPPQPLYFYSISLSFPLL